MLPRDPDGRAASTTASSPKVRWSTGTAATSWCRPQDGNLNRNYPSNWVPESQRYGSGEHPLSGRRSPRSCAGSWTTPTSPAWCHHSHSGVILRPWLTFPDTHFLGGDKRLYLSIGELGVAETGYHSSPSTKISRPTRASSALVRPSTGPLAAWAFPPSARNCGMSSLRRYRA